MKTNKDFIEESLINFYKSMECYPTSKKVTKNYIIHKFINHNKRIYLTMSDDSMLGVVTTDMVDNIYDTSINYVHDGTSLVDLYNKIKIFLKVKDEIK